MRGIKTLLELQENINNELMKHGMNSAHQSLEQILINILLQEKLNNTISTRFVVLNKIQSLCIYLKVNNTSNLQYKIMRVFIHIILYYET